MNPLSPEQVHALKVAELGLDASALDLTSPEALAAALRRAAGFLCPCAAPTLVRAVVRPLEGLASDLDAVRVLVEDTLEAMVAHGDLLEQPEIKTDGERKDRVLLYPAPPSFVARSSGAALLLGISPDELSPLPNEFQTRIEYVKHIRRLPAEASLDWRSELTQLGLIELTDATWLKTPTPEGPAQHLQRMDKWLDLAPSSGDVPGLQLLDPARPVHFYRGRWTELRAQTGRFMGRRSQAYGANLWCYVEVRDGRPERFIDLHLVGSNVRGCDEAWWLQMAIDAVRGEPQRYRLREGARGMRALEFFSPVPMWAQRRWDAVGEPSLSGGCLFSYRFRDNEISEEVRFARDILWLSELTENRER